MVADSICEARTRRLHDDINLIRETANANALMIKNFDKAVNKMIDTLNGNGKKGFFEKYGEDKRNMWIAIIVIGTGGVGSGIGFLNMLRVIFKI